MVRIVAKSELRTRAITLRERGKTYREILEEVNVSKSTLSLWLRGVGLTRRQQQRITKKKKAAQQRGGDTKRAQRVSKTERIHREAQNEIGSLTERERWLIGVALYWAEGAKAKAWNPSVGLDFANSDSSMIRFFIEWLQDFCDVPVADISLRLLLHETHKHRLAEVKTYWSKKTKLPIESIVYVYFKKNILRTKRKNLDNSSYFGLISLRVKRSTDLNRRIEGWKRGIVQ